MKTAIKKVVATSMKVVAGIATVSLYTSANSATSVWQGQPKAPKELENYKIR